MLAFVMLWAYTAFSQFLLIWYGNLKEEVLPHLAGHRRVITFDFLGWGGSDKPAGHPYTAHNQTGDLDAVTFTAGVGEHNPRVRADALTGLGFLGVALDEGANAACVGVDRDEPVVISTADSAVRVLVVATDEAGNTAHCTFTVTVVPRQLALRCDRAGPSRQVVRAAEHAVGQVAVTRTGGGAQHQSDRRRGDLDGDHFPEGNDVRNDHPVTDDGRRGRRGAGSSLPGRGRRPRSPARCP